MRFYLKAEKGFEGFNKDGNYVKKDPGIRECYETTINSEAGGKEGKSYTRIGHVDEDIIKAYPREYRAFKADLEVRRAIYENAALYELEHGKPFVEEIKNEEVIKIKETETTHAELDHETIKEKKKK